MINVNENPSNSFVCTFIELRDGDALNEASEKLAELVQAVNMQGKPGTFTLKLKVAPAARAAIAILDTIEIKPPVMENDATLLYAGEDGSLTRDNPHQKTFDLKAVPGKSVEEKDLNQTAKAVNE